MKTLLTICLICTLALLSCDPNHHRPTDHPCNFPDAETENGLRDAWSFFIIDELTLKNLVDTTKNAGINRDSVKLFDENFELIPAKHYYSKFCPEWSFVNFYTHYGVPFNDPQALLDLSHKVFYLRTSISDIDTIDVYYSSCLVSEVYFNGLDTKQPKNDPSICGASFYFRK